MLKLLPTLLILALFSEPRQALGFVACADGYSKEVRIQGQEVGFTQGWIGRYWALLKHLKLEEKYAVWLLKNEGGGRQDFLLEKMKEKPFKAIRDVDGRTRIVDNHHKYYAMSLFYGKELDFALPVFVIRDYSKPRVTKRGLRPWSEKEMMTDLVNNNYLSRGHDGSPQAISWLRETPDSIFKLEDSPERSVVSLVLDSFRINISGSDFQPHIQNLLIERLQEMGIDILSEKPYSKSNIKRLRLLIEQTPELHNFLIQNLQIERDNVDPNDVIQMLTGK